MENLKKIVYKGKEYTVNNVSGDSKEYSKEDLTWESGRYSNSGIGKIDESGYYRVAVGVELLDYLKITSSANIYINFADYTNTFVKSVKNVSGKILKTHDYKYVYITAWNNEPTSFDLLTYSADYNQVNKNTTDIKDLMLKVGNIYHYDKRLKNYLGEINYKNTNDVEASESGDYFIVSENDTKAATYTIKNCEVAYLDALLYDGERYHRIKLQEINQLPNGSEKDIYDVCIIGGGAGGVGAGFALNNKHMKVCLIERNSMLGGTHTVGGVVDYCHSPAPAFFYDKIYLPLYENGLIDTSYGLKEDDPLTTADKGYHRTECLYVKPGDTASYNGKNLMVFARDAVAELYRQNLCNIDVKLNREFIGVNEYENNDGMNTCYSIKVKNQQTGGEEIINARFFIDATEGLLIKDISDKVKGSSALGEDYFRGTDPKTLYNESAYNDNNPTATTAISNMDLAFRYGGDPYKDEDTTNWPNNGWWSWNVLTGDYGNRNFSIMMPDKGANFSIEELTEKGLDGYYREAYEKVRGYWKYIKKDMLKNGAYKLDSISPMIVVREWYRMNCDTMITQDYATRRIDTDSDIIGDKTIALSKWYFDMHAPDEQANQYSSYYGLPRKNLDNIQVETYGVPYGALCPKKMKNVMIASHCLGASHIGQSTCRITKTMLSVGYAAGFAAYHYIDGGLSDMRDVDVTKIQNDVKLTERIQYQEDFCYPYDPYRTWDASTKKYEDE